MGTGLLKRINQMFCCKTLKKKFEIMTLVMYCRVLKSEDSAINQTDLVSFASSAI